MQLGIPDFPRNREINYFRSFHPILSSSEAERDAGFMMWCHSGCEGNIFILTSRESPFQLGYFSNELDL